MRPLVFHLVEQVTNDFYGGKSFKISIQIYSRYNLGKQRLQEEFGLEVVEMENTLKGAEFIYRHPEKRAEDLMKAFSDPSIKAIFSIIGGSESVRMLPYIDYNIIKNNPKIFIGYSDTTVTHFICLKAGISSFYGASILAEFAENVGIFPYTKEWIQKTLFSNKTLGNIPASPTWTGEHIPWDEENKNKERIPIENKGYEFLQGKGSAQGHLIGGCMEVLEMIKGTEIWPEKNYFNDSIIFFETSEDMPPPNFFEYWLRNYGSLGILNKVKGILFGKPYQEKYYEEYKVGIKKVLSEFGVGVPVVYDVNFGHTAPMICIPYGALARIDCEGKTIEILASGVLEK